ncbi:hypothetical protein [Nocardia wallacei]|uniref:Uncharacterized protein n=1 Tax=Nocardia wallacei TaxID=480035 RepID=A0A7G1KW27_9NOCA|nr:hypothetical protein [Nocardia wallacei]BCK58383.1 hypothetical protein NWFMUON74_61550 [Nocardia wallacei]
MAGNTLRVLVALAAVLVLFGTGAAWQAGYGHTERPAPKVEWRIR